MAKASFRPRMLTRVVPTRGPMIQPPAPSQVVPTATSNIVPGIVTPTMTSGDFLGELGTLVGASLGGPIGAGIGGALGGALDRRLAGPTGQQDCPAGFVRSQFGICEFVGSPGDVSTGGVSTTAVAIPATAGGGGVSPTVSQRTVLRCPPGMVLGKDNRCYRSLPKRDRKWNPGRKPLLTGGEMNAIATAARAAKKLKRAEKRLAKAGRTLAPRKAPRRSSGTPRRTVMGPTPTHSLTVIDTE